LQQATAYAGDLSLIGMCMLFSLQLVGRLDLGTKLLLWGLIVSARAMLGLAAGETAAGFFPMLVLLILYCTVTRLVPWKTMLLGFLALLIARAIMVPFRDATWASGDTEPLNTKAVMFAQATREMLASRETPYQYMIQFTLNRLTCSTVVAQVMHETPDDVPYWGGATLYPILFKPIPRLIWPDKPQEISGQTFGHRYGLLSEDDSGTSFNLPQVAELYINFGVVGVLIGMFLCGMLYRASLSLFIHPGMGFGAVVASAYVSALWTDIESALGLSFGGVFWGIVFIGLIHLVVEFGELMAAGPALGYSLGRSA